VPEPSGSSQPIGGVVLRPRRVTAKSLAEVVGRLGLPLPPGANPAAAVTGLTHDSRAVQDGDLYAALPGSRTHGASFAGQAAAAGAVAVLTDPVGAPSARAAGLPVLVVDDPRHRLGDLAAWLYDEPGGAMATVGVTGTDGKTTTAFLVEGALRAAGLLTGLVGTITTRVAGEDRPAARTTPEAPDLQALLAVMRERGVRGVALEVSSHALVMGRVDGLVVDVAVFTNLSQEHLDFHVTMEDYFTAKASLFTPRHARRAVVWVDDSYGRRLARQALDAGLPVTTVGARRAGAPGPPGPDVSVEVTEALPGGGQRIRLTGALEVSAEVGLPGVFNATNAALALVAVSHLDGVDLAAAATGLASVRVPGRMEIVSDGGVLGGGVLAVVDFAHTPEAIAAVLAELRPRTQGRLVVVLGAGGDRDRTKRPAMGEAAARLADVVVVTDDNPRSEDPASIRAALRAGADAVASGRGVEVLEVADRAQAILRAVHLTHPGDTLAVLGKGHEQGQEIAGTVRPFDDRTVLAEALRDPVRPRAGSGPRTHGQTHEEASP